jgi:hypothetical protein
MSYSDPSQSNLIKSILSILFSSINVLSLIAFTTNDFTPLPFLNTLAS